MNFCEVSLQSSRKQPNRKLIFQGVYHHRALSCIVIESRAPKIDNYWLMFATEQTMEYSELLDANCPLCHVIYRQVQLINYHLRHRENLHERMCFSFPEPWIFILFIHIFFAALSWIKEDAMTKVLGGTRRIWKSGSLFAYAPVRNKRKSGVNSVPVFSRFSLSFEQGTRALSFAFARNAEMIPQLLYFIQIRGFANSLKHSL